MATFVEIVTYGGATPDSIAYQQAWEKDVKEAQELRQKVLNFLDGLLLLSSNRRGNSLQSDQSIHVHIGDKALLVGNLVVSRSITNSFNKIESAEISDELKKALRDLANAVNAMTTEMPNEIAEQVAHDLKTLTTEATSKSPRPQWCQLSVEGLKKAAKNVGEIGLPVGKLAATILTLLSIKP